MTTPDVEELVKAARRLVDACCTAVHHVAQFFCKISSLIDDVKVALKK